MLQAEIAVRDDASQVSEEGGGASEIFAAADCSVEELGGPPSDLVMEFQVRACCPSAPVAQSLCH